MADKSTIYRGTVQLSDVDRNCYEALELTLAQHPSETTERLIARIIAYALNYEEGLSFSKGICDGDTPDIILESPGEKMKRWIEVGEASVERLTMACRKANKVKLYFYAKQPWRWEQANLEKLSGLTNLTIIRIPYELLTALSQSLQRNFDWTLTVTDGVIYLDTGNRAEELELVRLLPADS